MIGEGDLATLVIRPDNDGVTLLPGTVAQVTGTAEPFVLADVEQRLGVDLVDEDFAVFETHLYIDAINVNLLDED